MKTGVDPSGPHPADDRPSTLDPTGPGAGPPPDARGLHATAIGEHQLYLVIAAEESDDAEGSARSSYREVAALLAEKGMAVVHERIFGSLGAREAALAGRRAALGAHGVPDDNPTTFIEGRPPWGEGFAGALLQAVSTREASSEVWTIRDGDVPCGRGWKMRGATYLCLHDLHGTAGDPAPAQTRAMIERAEKILREQGASYHDVVRTWFYLNDILGWYDDFNAARSAKYDELGIMPSEERSELLLPASTGIEGVAPHRAAGAMDLIAAFGPPESRPDIRQLSNAGQKDAYRYGSAFSRGAVIHEPEATVLQLSGTASIDESGATIHVDDPRAQIECTLDKIELLLRQAGARLRDVAAATAFVKHAAHADLFWRILAERGLDAFPAVCVVADVCRDDLLFEMDGEVIYRPGQGE